MPATYTLKTDPRDARLLAQHAVGDVVYCDVWKIGRENAVRCVPGRVVETPDSLTTVVELTVPVGYELRS